MNIIKARLKQVILVIGIIMSSTLYCAAQTTEYESEEELGDEYVEDQRFFNDMNEDRFKSNLHDIKESSKIDYSNPNSRRERTDFNVFGNENEVYHFEGNENQSISPNNSRIMSGVDGSSWQQAPSSNHTPETNLPAVNNPFGSNPGVRAPRNMDAVPDNGDDPNDVPLDGGVSILGIAALAFGFSKFKKQD